MKKTLISFFCLCFILSGTFARIKNKIDPLNNVSIDYLKNSFATYDKLQKAIWIASELGFLETQSSGLLQQHLLENGFSLQSDVAGMPTAFVASYGSGSPVIGILAEFDALPGLSQDTIPYRKPLIKGGNGHGCGHNVFGVGSVAGAVAIKKWLEKNNYSGTIRLFGTPAEEGGGGKVYMAREGIFNEVDVMLDWHPGTANFVNVGSGTAVLMIDYTFHGISSHAANNPEKGRSALDGVEAMNYMVNLMREHIPISSRIHYVISYGGEAANVVPDYAKVSYYIRSPQRELLKELENWVNLAAEGAAKGTQTNVTSEIICGFYEKLDNRKLAELIQKKIELVGGIEYDDRERLFAEEIARSVNQEISGLKKVKEVLPLAEEKPSLGGGSTDVGDVSWIVPTTTFRTAVFIPGTTLHSWQNVAVCGSTIGTKGLLNAAKIFSLTAIDLYTNPLQLSEIKKEFNERRGDAFEYIPLLKDRTPALDYRTKSK
jgi:aminobenzoyl-glutamate utilization protein B